MEAQNQVVVSSKVDLPQQFVSYVEEKKMKNGSGGRPSLISQLAHKGLDAEQEVFNILELVWIKQKGIGSVAKKYEVEYTTIYRLLKDLEPSKEALIAYLQLTPRRKTWFNPELEQSDYETVQNFIKKAKRSGLKSWKRTLAMAQECFTFLNYRDPANWNADEVQSFLSTKKEGSQSGYLDTIRQVAPQIRDSSSEDYLATGRFREKLARHKKDLFGKEINMITKALNEIGLPYHCTIFKLHITIGAREGQSDSRSGLCGVSWDRLKKNFAFADDYESKVRGGIWWRDCPLTLFFQDLPEDLKTLWESRGRPTTDKILLNGYSELGQIYAEMRKALEQYFKDKVDPSLLHELATLKPHDADKIHVNLLWEAGIPLEVVAGQYLGRGEGVGLMGRGWLDINTIKKYYLSLTQRSQRFKDLRAQVETYSKQFSTTASVSDQLS